MGSAAASISKALHNALAPPSESQNLAPSAPSEALPISPWAMWLLLSLVQHEQRQKWVGDIVTNRLGGNPTDISAVGVLGHPPIKSFGLVPGLTDWEYQFHGRGCCLTNRLTGEFIDVDFYDGSAEWFDDYFFIGYVESLKQPSFVERRLIALHPTLKTISLSFDELLSRTA